MIKNGKEDILAKYLFIKGILHFYALEDKHDDPLVHTRYFIEEMKFCQFSFLFSTKWPPRMTNLDLDHHEFRLNTNVFGDRHHTLTSRRLIITYCDLINCSIWPNLAEYAKDVCEFEKEGRRIEKRKKGQRKENVAKKKNEEIIRKNEKRSVQEIDLLTYFLPASF